MVAGISLLDAIGRSPAAEDTGAAQARVANELVAAALDEHRHIEALDAFGPTSKSRRLYVRETASQMRQLHEAWLAPAAALLTQLREMRGAGRPVERLTELEEAVLETRGWLSMTPDQIEAGREQARRGDVSTLEEVRRGLRPQPGA